MEDFWSSDSVLKHDLDLVREQIRNTVDQSHGFIKSLLKGHVNSGGKMLRPALVLISSRLGNQDSRFDAIKVASILEMVHLASLIHDDILDLALTRLGLPTLYAKVGAKQAVLAGDYLLSKAMALVGDSKGDLKASAVANAFGRLCESELDQDAAQGDFFISKPTYIRRIAGKTAALFALSCYAGAATTKAELTDQYRMHRFGYAFGMSFQIQDDILDYVGNENDLGKQTGRDLQCGIPTIPLILALAEERKNNSNRPLAALLTDKGRQMNNKDTAKAVRMVVDLGGIEISSHMCDVYRERALADLSLLSNTEVSSTLRSLFIKLIDRPS